MKKIISVFLISCLVAYGATAEDSKTDIKKEDKQVSYTEQFNDWLYGIITWNPFKDPAFFNYIFGFKEGKKQEDAGQDTSEMQAIMSQAGTIKPKVVHKDLDKENVSLDLPTETNSEDKNLSNEIKYHASKNIIASDLLTQNNNDEDLDGLSQDITSYLTKEKLPDHLALETEIYEESTGPDQANNKNLAKNSKTVAEEIDELASQTEKEAELSAPIKKEDKIIASKDEQIAKSEDKKKETDSKPLQAPSSEGKNEESPSATNKAHASINVDKEQVSASPDTSQDKANNIKQPTKDEEIADKFKHGALKLLDKEQVQKKEKVDKQLSGFIEDEIQDLLLPEDDVVLGEISPMGTLEIMDSYVYLKLFWKNFYKFYAEDAKNGINRYIAALSKESEKFDFEEAKILAEEYVLAGDIEKLRIVIDNTSTNIAKYSDCDFSLLCFAVDVNQYNPAYYIVMRGANIRDILFDASRGNIAARASPLIIDMLKSLYKKYN